MKKFVSGLLCAAMTASLFTVMSGGASAAGTAVDSNWTYKEMVNFNELNDGIVFGSSDDSGYTMYCDGKSDWVAQAKSGGYKGSVEFYMTGKSDKTGTYAQPMINAGGFSEKNTEFKGANEFWMWVDFSSIEFDNVGLQFRLIEDDYNTDGTPATGDYAQISPGKGKPVYIQSGTDINSWKELTVKDDYKIPVADMKGYKGFIRMPLTSLVINDAGTDDDNGKINLENLFQAWFIFNYPNHSKAEYLGVDQLMFVGSGLTDGKAISKIDFTSTNQTGGGTKDTTKGGATTTTAAATTAAATTTAANTTAATTIATTKAATTTAVTTKATDAGTTPKDNNSALPIIIAVICVVVLGGGGAALYFFVLRKKKDGTDPENPDSGSGDAQ